MSTNDLRTFAPLDPKRIRFAPRETVIFRRDPNPEKVGSIVIPQTSRYRDRADVAVVVAVGAGINDVKKGDRLLLPDVLDVKGKFTGPEGATYTVMSKEQLGQVAVIEEP